MKRTVYQLKADEGNIASAKVSARNSHEYSAILAGCIDFLAHVAATESVTLEEITERIRKSAERLSMQTQWTEIKKGAQ